MQTRNLEVYSSAARDIVNQSISLPPEMGQVAIAETQDKINVLKFTMYIEQTTGTIINPASLDEVKNWISGHTTETQVFLNALGANTGGIDGIRGMQTLSAIEEKFGIKGVSAWVNTSSSDISNPTTIINENGEKEVVYPLPPYLQDEKEVRAMLDQLGVKGLRIEDGKLIGRMELDTQKKLEKLGEYLDYVNYLQSPEVTPEGKVKRYKELLDDTTDYIWDKQYLIQKYMISMYKDLLEKGCTIRQNGENGEYVIAALSATPDVVAKTNSVYGEIVSGAYARTAFIEFVRIYGIVESSNNPRFNEQDVSREGLVMHILQNNDIVSETLKPEIQSVEALLLNKVRVIEQLGGVIDSLSGGVDKNNNQYQEAIWLYDFLKNESYKQDDIQRDTFNQVNHYKNIFMKEQSFIDTLSAEGIDPNGPVSDSVIEKVQKVLGKNSTLLIMFGLLMMVFKDTRKYGVGLILGTAAANIGLNIASDTAKEAGLTDTGGTVGDAFDMFKPIDLKHRIKYPDGFDRGMYDPILEGLYSANDTRRTGGEIENGTAMKHTDNAKIALIFQEVMGQDALLKIDTTSGDTNAIAQSIYKDMKSKSVTETSFESRVPEEQRGDVTLDDVIVFLELLGSQREDGDTSLHDLIIKEKSLSSTEYSDKNFTTDDNFDAALNTTLLERWEANTPSPTLSIADSMKGRKEILDLSNQIQTSLSSGSFDGVFDWSSTLNWDTFHRGSAEQVSLIATLISNISTNPNLNADTKTALIDQNKGILRELQVYILGKVELSTILGENGIFKRIQAKTPGQTPQELQAHITDLDGLIAQLDPKAFAVSGNAHDLTNSIHNGVFTNLVHEIETNKNILLDQKQRLEIDRATKLDEENGTLENSIRLLKEAALKLKTSLDPNTVFPDYAEPISELRDKWISLKGQTFVAGSIEEKMQTQLKDIFEGKFMADLEADLKKAYEKYFEENKKVIDDEINSITISVGDINSTLSQLNTLKSIEKRQKDELGSFETFYAFMTGTDPVSKTEKGYKKAQTVFTSLKANNDETTLFKVAETATEKQNEIATALFEYVNTLSTFDQTSFDALYRMETLGIVDIISDLGVSPDFNKIFADKYSRATIGYISSIPVNVSGIQELRQFEANYLSRTPGLGERISSILGGGDNITPIFTNQVKTVAATILRNNFSEDTTGLSKIIDFKNGAGSSDYTWISSKDDSFEASYEARIEVIASTVINGFSQDIDGLKALIQFKNSSIYGDVFAIVGNNIDTINTQKLEQIRNTIISNTPVTSSQLILSDGKTFKEIMESIGQRIQNTNFASFVTGNKLLGVLINDYKLNETISSDHNGLDKGGREQLQNALKDLNLI